ncbi:MAG: PopZ family protein [Xanthobacteraceae bacterium]|jgi:cell pole-organizing protein PopZ
MEEILASIRRIIADDTPGAAKPVAAAPASPPPQFRPAADVKAMSQDDIDAMMADNNVEEEEEVLDLVEPVQPPRAAPAASFRQVPDNDVTFREDPFEEPATVDAPVYVPPSQPQQVKQPERLLSAETNAAVTAAFGTLATTILAENSRSIEDLVRELLRPMLKAWLDDNLPGLVERLVRVEIERVSRGGR